MDQGFKIFLKPWKSSCNLIVKFCEMIWQFNFDLYKQDKNINQRNVYKLMVDEEFINKENDVFSRSKWWNQLYFSVLWIDYLF